MFKALRQLTQTILGPSKSDPKPAASQSKGAAQASAQLGKAREMRVKKLVRETADAVVIHLEPSDGSALPTFHPGQFLNVCVELNGEPTWRSYSICTAPHSGELAIAVKRVSGGRVSSYLNEQAKEGQLLTVRGPSGTFLLAERTGPRHVLLVAGGSGITPLMSQAKHLLAIEPDSKVTLLYGNRSLPDIIFHRELRELSVTYQERFTVRHVLSTPADELEHAHGMLDEATAVAELTRLGAAQQAFQEHMLCGPEPMMKATRAALLSLGVAEALIREERFTAAKSALLPQVSAGDRTVYLRAGGMDHVVQPGPDETILDAALRSKIPLEFSCTVGMCGTCMGELHEGDVQMEEPNCLTDEQRADRKILPCVARPTGPCRVEIK